MLIVSMKNILTLTENCGRIKGAVVATTTTSVAEGFMFENVPPGVYNVVELTPSGFVNAGDSDGSDPNTIRVDITTTYSTCNTFVDKLARSAPNVSGALTGVPSSGPNASPKPPNGISGTPCLIFVPSGNPTGAPSSTTSPTDSASGSVEGIIREDTNNDDVCDSIIAGVLILLKDSRGNTIATALSGSDGTYKLLDSMRAGTHSPRVC